GGHIGHAPDPFFHFLAWLEGNDVLGRNVHLVSRAWIACFAGLTLLDFEDAEVSQLDAAHFDERVNDGVEGLLYDFLGLELGKPDAVGYLFDDLFLGHGPFLLRQPSKEASSCRSVSRLKSVWVNVKVKGRRNTL